MYTLLVLDIFLKFIQTILGGLGKYINKSSVLDQSDKTVLCWYFSSIVYALFKEFKNTYDIFKRWVDIKERYVR